MQFPVSIHFGEYRILLHALLEPIAFFAGFRYFLLLKKRKGDNISEANRVWIIIACVFGALLGSRLVGGLENPLQLEKSDNLLLHFYTNKTILGGLLGGLLAVEAVKKRVGEKRASGDLFVYPILLAMIVGRIGCFSMGVFEETYGLPTSLPTGMMLGDGILRHPVSLYEIVFLVLLWVCLSLSRKKYNLAEGALFKLFMIAYLVFRFFLDFIKPRYVFGIGLSTIQITSLLGLLWYVRYLVSPKKFLKPAAVPQMTAYA